MNSQPHVLLSVLARTPVAGVCCALASATGQFEFRDVEGKNPSGLRFLSAGLADIARRHHTSLVAAGAAKVSRRVACPLGLRELALALFLSLVIPIPFAMNP